MNHLLRPGSDGACLCPDQYPTEISADVGGQTTNIPWDYWWADLIIAEIEAEFPRRPVLQRMLAQAKAKLEFIKRQLVR